MRVRWLKAVAQFSPQYQQTSHKEGERGEPNIPKSGARLNISAISVGPSISVYLLKSQTGSAAVKSGIGIRCPSGRSSSVRTSPWRRSLFATRGKIDIHGLNIGSAKRRIQIWRPTEPVPNSVHRVQQPVKGGSFDAKWRHCSRKAVKSLFVQAGKNSSKIRREKRMSDNADLESKTVEALRHYREALAAVENLEREEASAHRALTSMLPDLGCALLEGEGRHLSSVAV